MASGVALYPTAEVRVLPGLKKLEYKSQASPIGIYSHLYLSICISVLEIVVMAEYWESLDFSVFYLKVLRVQSPAFSLQTYKVNFLSQKLYYINKS